MDRVELWLFGAGSQVSKVLLGQSTSILTSTGQIGGQCLKAESRKKNFSLTNKISIACKIMSEPLKQTWDS